MQSVSVSPNGLKTETLCVGIKPDTNFLSHNLSYRLSNPQKITCIIFENLFGPYFLPHQSHSYVYAPSSGENLTSKMSFKSDATYYFHIT